MLEKLRLWRTAMQIKNLEAKSAHCRQTANDAREFADELDRHADYYQSRADRLKTTPHRYSL